MNMLICGIDEAGRGPVIGPMVMVGVVVNEEGEAKLKGIGVKDSKLLTPKQREKLFNKILDIAENHKIVILQPAEIDAALDSDYLNLNWLEAQTSANIITGLKPGKVILDCPSNNIPAYTNYIIKLLEDKNIDVIAEHKADFNYPVVAAASILAKVTRDSEIEKIKKKVGDDFGSGYMADPKTKSFLEKNFEKHPEIFRKTWISYQEVVNNKNQKKLDDF